jgi:tripartite-type tricarboxylate transporter receptor subunit TctC
MKALTQGTRLSCLVSIVVLFLPLFGSVKPVAAQESFYKGKTIKIVVGLSAGGGYDRAARLLARYMGKSIPGNPDFIVQNMAGAGSIVAANYVYNVAKPDGLTLLMPHNNLYLTQLSGDKEVKFDLLKMPWIGSLDKDDMMLFMRSDAPYKSIKDVVKAKEPPKCGSTGVGASDYVLARILEETIGAKVNQVVGYPGSNEIAIAVERGEVACMGLTIQTFFSREPFMTWLKGSFVHFLTQSGRKRDARVNAPTIFELMDEYKTPAPKRRLAQAMLAGGEWARSMLVAPATPPERVQILRDAYEKAAKDPDLLTEAKKLKMDIEPGKASDLQAMAKEAMNQPPEIVEQIKKLFVQQ